MTLYTANGPVEVDKVVPINVGRLGKADVLILEETPAVFSIGKRVMHEGYSFIWRAGKRPYMLDHNKTKINLEVEGDIPYLVDESIRNYACPAEEAPTEVVSIEHAQQESSPSSIEKRESKDDRLKRESTSTYHLMTHMPQNPFCATCRAAKLRKASARKVEIQDRNIAKTFGERVHADHVFPKDVNEDEKGDNTTALALKE